MKSIVRAIPGSIAMLPLKSCQPICPQMPISGSAFNVKPSLSPSCRTLTSALCTTSDIMTASTSSSWNWSKKEKRGQSSKVKFRSALPPEQALLIASQLAEALAAAHKIGITHRDLKPSNIMLTKSGTKLMDFGLAEHADRAPLTPALTEMTQEAKLTSEGMLVGTFQYMAPEQLEGKEADPRTDIFFLGESIYEMVTGKPPFSGKSRASLIATILMTDPQPMAALQPMTPASLERVVRECLAKDPEERWQSASDLASELKWIKEGVKIGKTIAHKDKTRLG